MCLKRSIFSLLLLLMLNGPALASGQVNVEIEKTRIIFNANKNQTYWSLENKASETYFFIASVHETNARLDLGKKTTGFIVSPPSGLIRPNERTVFRIVKTNDTLSNDVESLALLQVKLLSAVHKPEVTKSHHFQNLVKLFIKLFHRPVDLIDDRAVVKQLNTLTATCWEGNLKIKNPSNYWLTVDAVMIGKQNILNHLDKKPLLAPLGHWNKLINKCPTNVNIKLLDETGLPTHLKSIDVEGVR